MMTRGIETALTGGSRLNGLALAALMLIGAIARADDVDSRGDPLPDGALARLGTYHFRQTGSCDRAAFSTDGKLLAVGFENHAHWNIHLWDAVTGRRLKQFKSNSQYLYDLRFTPDGKSLVVASGDGKVHVWNTATGEELTLARTLNHVFCVALSTDGKTLHTGVSDGIVESWKMPSAEQRTRFKVEGTYIESLNVSPDGKRLLVQSGKNGASENLFLVDAASGELIVTTERASTLTCRAIYSPDGKLFFGVTGMDDQPALRCWDAATGELVRRYPLIDRVKNSSIGIEDFLTLSPDGRFAAFSATSKEGGAAIEVIGLASGEILRTISVSCKRINNLAWSPNGDVIAVCTDQGIRMVDPATGNILYGSAGHFSPVFAVQFTSDTNHVLSMAGDGTMRVWDAKKGKQLRSLVVPMTAKLTLTVTDNDRVICTCNNNLVVSSPLSVVVDGKMKDKDDMRLHGELADSHLSAIAVSGNGKYLAAASAGSNRCQVELSNCLTGAGVGRLILPGAFGSDDILPDQGSGSGLPLLLSARTLAVTNDGRYLSALCDDGTLRVCDVTSKSQIRQVNADGMGLLQFSANGYSLLAAGPVIRLWERASGRLRWEAKLPKGTTASAVVFSPDSRLIAVGCDDGSISLRATPTGKEVGLLLSGQGSVPALHFSRDGQRLASGGADCTVVIWDIAIYTKAEQPGKVELNGDDLDAAWQNVTKPDAGKAYRAMQRLIDSGDGILNFVAERLKQPLGPDPKAISRLIAELDSEDFKVRDAANKSLEEMGEAAEEALKKATESDSLEIRSRAQRILDGFKINRQPANLYAQRGVEILETIGTRNAVSALTKLAENDKNPATAVPAREAIERLRGK